MENPQRTSLGHCSHDMQPDICLQSTLSCIPHCHQSLYATLYVLLYHLPPMACGYDVRPDICLQTLRHVSPTACSHDMQSDIGLQSRRPLLIYFP